MRYEGTVRLSRLAGTGILAILLVALPIAANAAEQSAISEAGFGTTAAVATVVYGTVKIVYALGGTLVGSLGWILSGGRTDVARAIMQPALRGDYVITPEHLVGRKALNFVGRDPVLEPYDSR